MHTAHTAGPARFALNCPLVVTFPCGPDDGLINVRDAADNCLYGYCGGKPGEAAALHSELVRRANAHDALLAALQKIASRIPNANGTMPELDRAECSNIARAAIASATGAAPAA